MVQLLSLQHIAIVTLRLQIIFTVSTNIIQTEYNKVGWTNKGYTGQRPIRLACYFKLKLVYVYKLALY